GSQGVTCVDRLRIAASDQSANSFYVREGDLFHTSPRNDGLPALNSDPWSAADAVEGWLSGAFPNFGLVLQGYNELLFQGDEDASRNTDKCQSALSNFELQVAVFWDVPPAPDLQALKLEATDKNGGAGCFSGSLNPVATVRNEGDGGVGGFDVLLNVDGRPRETVAGLGVGPYGDVQARFSALDLTAGAHTLEAIVDPDLQVKELELNDK